MGGSEREERLLDRLVWGIPLRYWIAAVVLWAVSGICMYLMFVLSSPEVDTSLSTVSTITGVASVVTLLVGATRSDVRRLESATGRLEGVVREGFSRQERLLREVLEELRRR